MVLVVRFIKVDENDVRKYMNDPTQHSVNGWACFLEGHTINSASKMMPIITLSVIEAELYVPIQCVMDMLFAMRVLFSMGIEVELPMILEVDNKATVKGSLKERRRYAIRSIYEESRRDDIFEAVIGVGRRRRILLAGKDLQDNTESINDRVGWCS